MRMSVGLFCACIAGAAASAPRKERREIVMRAIVCNREQTNVRWSQIRQEAYMFEKALLARTRRSPWSWGGLVVQAGVVAGLVIVPMVHPEVIAVILPKALLHVPAKQPPPVEVEVQQTAQAAATPGQVTVARRYTRTVTAPSSWNNAPNTILDPDSVPMFSVGPPIVGAIGPFLIGTSQTSLPTAPPPSPERKPDVSKPVKVGGLVKPPTIVFRVNPAYPPLAKAARIQGVVKLEGIIAKNGAVVQLKVIGGHPLLVKASLDAVAQWRYTPTLLNGEPVDVIAPIDVNFILS
ncbi:MAG: energy transducer TonB, partial [Acidobacteria bacterium]|nr:energy transducer TonB [Acidobacteriota bacterium]